MRQAPKALQREWQRRLKASGFIDLEVGNGEVLSNRGTVSRPTREDEQRRQEEADYHDNAVDILNHARLSPHDREIWRRHVEGQGMHVMANELGLSYHEVRETIRRVSSTGRAQDRKATKDEGSKCRMVSLIRQTDPQILGILAAAIVRSLTTPSSSSGNASTSSAGTSAASRRSYGKRRGT